MKKVKLLWEPALCSALLLTVLMTTTALAQTANSTAVQGDSQSLTGTVVSSGNRTVVVRTSDGQYRLFIIDKNTVTPRPLAAGTRVEVHSIAGDEPNVRRASTISVSSAASAQTGDASQPMEPVPPEIREIERDIERQAKRFRLGIRGGVGLDPEVVMIGAHTQLGPFFNPDLFFRPNAEFAWGEVTSLFALNLEAIYRLPVSSREGRWSAYAGGGPAFSFMHQDFNRPLGNGEDFDFGDFEYSTGLNILGGIQYRSGMFLELKASVYAEPAPTLRMIVGYQF